MLWFVNPSSKRKNPATAKQAAALARRAASLAASAARMAKPAKAARLPKMVKRPSKVSKRAVQKIAAQVARQMGAIRNPTGGNMSKLAKAQAAYNRARMAMYTPAWTSGADLQGTPSVYVQKAAKRIAKAKAALNAAKGIRENPTRSTRAHSPGGKSMAKKLYGAAAKAHAKRLSKLHRKRARKNPHVQGMHLAGAVPSAPAKKPKRARKATALASSYPKTAKEHAKRRAPKRKPTRRAPARSSISVSHASAPRRARKGSSMKKRSKASYAAAVRKGARTRARNLRAGKKSAPRRAKARRSYQYVTKHVGGAKKQWRGYKSLKRARNTIKYERHYGTKRSKGYIKRFKMRTNPILGTLKNVLATALPVAAGYYGGKVLCNVVKKYVPQAQSTLGVHANPVVSLLLIVAGNFATSKIKPLQKYKSGLMIGLGVNLVDQLIKTYAPASVQGYLGAYDGTGAVMYDTAGIGEYLQTDGMGEYLETGEYVSTGADVQAELGLEEDLGADQMLAPISRQLPATAAAAGHSMRGQVPHWSPEFAQGSLYTGIFGGNKLG